MISMMREGRMTLTRLLAASVFTAGALTGCANWTVAPIGQVEVTTRTTDGELREESVVGLFALPTPSHRTVLLFPLFKSSRLPEARTNQLPSTVQAWAAGPEEMPPALAP